MVHIKYLLGCTSLNYWLKNDLWIDAVAHKHRGGKWTLLAETDFIEVMIAGAGFEGLVVTIPVHKDSLEVLDRNS